MKKQKKYNILENIDTPRDIKKMNTGQLASLSDEVRDFLIESVAQTGGHFGSNLGVVELTVALHNVFDTPEDKIIWDVGHQAYPHKILTGRRKKFYSIRQKGGLTPFPKRDESKHDAFGVGHSATSISAAVGMERANRDKRNPPNVVAVIGDGALTGGMAFEALNHAGDIKSDVLVILNDNKMSISPNVGAMHKYLTRLISSEKFQRVRRKSKDLLSKKVPTVHEVARRAELGAKGMITPGLLFEELGFAYYGPIDGHDVGALVEVLGNIKNIKGPRFLHVITQKGRGYKYAKKDPTSLHAVSPFDPKTGEKFKKNKNKTYTEVFGDWTVNKAKKNKKLHAITPAMCEGSGLGGFREKFANVYHDVGIAEQHALTFAAGLACEGKKPVVAIYSTFLQRAYDQFIHDIAIQNLDVMLAVDRAGIVGPDGATHAGSFDFSFLRCVPNTTILAPADLNECEKMLDFAFELKCPTIVRYPRGGGEEKLKNNNTEITLGKAQVLKDGNEKVAVLAFGAMVEICLEAFKDDNITVVNMRFVKPLDINLLKELAKDHKVFVTVEDNVVAGGAGSAVCEAVANNDIDVNVKNLGLPDQFTQHGTRNEIFDEVGLSAEKINNYVKRYSKTKN